MNTVIELLPAFEGTMRRKGRTRKFTCSTTGARGVEVSPLASIRGGIEVKQGVVYVLSSRVAEYTTSGALISTWLSAGTGDNQLNKPYVGIDVDENGSVYIADSKNHRVKVFAP
jgi:NHL repeat-containing protein